MRAVDLFCGCGGMSLGFQNAGYEILGAFDNWEPAVRTYEKNFTHPVHKADLSDEGMVRIVDELKPEIIIGGPPCQDFSSAGHRDETRGRAALSKTYTDIVSTAKPKYFVMENVPRIRLSETYQYVRHELKNVGYGLTEKIMDASYNTTGTLRGGFNQTESELNMTDRYMKYVYDFTTSQANGTIACVCLTHKNAGYSSYGGKDSPFGSNYGLGMQVCDGHLQYVYNNCTGASTGDKYSGMSIGTTEAIFLINMAEDAVYYFRIDNATKITITKRRAYMKSVSVLENPYTTKPLMDSFELEELKTELPTNYISYNFDPADNCLYLVNCANYYLEAGGTFIVTKVNFSTWKVTQYTMTNTTSERINLNGMRTSYCHRGFMVFRGYNNSNHIYKMEIGNSANVELLKLVDFTTVYGSFAMGINGRIYIEGYSSGIYYLYIINLDTNEILKVEASRILNGSNYPCYTPVLNEPMLWYGSYGNWSTLGYFIMSNYLATINNLSEPVTKTADKTMKVTYIIQEQ